MSTRELVRDLESAGCSIRFGNGKLQAFGPLTPELRTRINTLRSPLIAHLASAESTRLRSEGRSIEARSVELAANWAKQWTATGERICMECGEIAQRDGTALCLACQEARAHSRSSGAASIPTEEPATAPLDNETQIETNPSQLFLAEPANRTSKAG